MAIIATVTSQQTIQFDVPGLVDSQGASRVIVTTGIAQFNLQVIGTGGQNSQSQSVRFLVDPVIPPGSFRKATGIVGFGNVSTFNAGSSQILGWSIDDIATSLDDESGKVELRFDARVLAAGEQVVVTLSSATFQVTTVIAI